MHNVRQRTKGHGRRAQENLLQGGIVGGIVGTGVTTRHTHTHKDKQRKRRPAKNIFYE